MYSYILNCEFLIKHPVYFTFWDFLLSVAILRCEVCKLCNETDIFKYFYFNIIIIIERFLPENNSHGKSHRSTGSQVLVGITFSWSVTAVFESPKISNLWKRKKSRRIKSGEWGVMFYWPKARLWKLLLQGALAWCRIQLLFLMFGLTRMTRFQSIL